jgi:hypothetical protein
VQPLATGDHQPLEQVQAVLPARQRHRQLPRPGLDPARVRRGDQEGRVALAGDDAVIPALPLGRGERGEGGVEVHGEFYQEGDHEFVLIVLFLTSIFGYKMIACKLSTMVCANASEEGI